MTRCRHCNYNYQLKSSAYNPTGECLEVQLSSYKAMTNHLRRILTAKSVVDSGKMDKKVTRRRDVKLQKDKIAPGMRHQRLDINSNSKVSHSLSQNDIDRLVYDTKHHPNDIASLACRRSKHRMVSSNYEYKKNSNRSNSTDSSDDYILRGNREFPQEYYGRRMNDEFEDIKKFCKSDLQVHLPRVKSSSEEIPEFIASLFYGTRSTFNIADYADLMTTRPRTKQDVVSLTGNEDSSIYVKFVYDITKEVMDRGLYDDSEIDDVLRRHFNRNLGRLNKRKMKLEINRLRRSLNMKYDSDEDEDETEEDEASDKRSGQRFPVIGESKEDSTRKEILLVTKEDIMKTLLEMDLNPEKARKICDSLQNNSSPGIPRVETRSPNVNVLEDSNSRNEETRKELNNSVRQVEKKNMRIESESAEKKEKKSTERITSAASDSDSEQNSAKPEFESTDVPVVRNERSKLTDNIIDNIDVSVSEDSSIDEEIINVDESDETSATENKNSK